MTKKRIPQNEFIPQGEVLPQRQLPAETQQSEVVWVENSAERNLQELGALLATATVGLRYAGAHMAKGVQRVFRNIPPEVMNEITPARDARVPVNVPAALWAGKTPQAVFKALKDVGYEDDLIAYVMEEKCIGSKTNKGRPFLPEGSDGGVYRRKFDDLVKQAKQRYILL